MLWHESGLLVRIAAYVTFFGGVLSLLMTVEQLNQKKRTRLNYRSAAMFFISGMVLLQTGLYLIGLAQEKQWFWFFNFTVIFMIGPINFWHNASYTEQNFSFNRLHLLPVVIGLVMDLSFNLRGRVYVSTLLEDILTEPGMTLGKVPFLLAGTHAFMYCLYGFVTQVMVIAGDRGLARKSYLLPLAQFVAMLGILSILLGLLLGNHSLIAGGTSFIGFNMILAMLFHNRLKEIVQTAGNEIKASKASKYKRSLLDGEQTDGIRSRVEGLMLEERIYEEMELNIKTMAARLSLSPQQLSQFLNEEMGMNFRSYVNRYRIEEAKRQLVEEKDKNILDICFNVGFSSKSAFYAIFKKETGMTPNQFRSSFEEGVPPQGETDSPAA